MVYLESYQTKYDNKKYELNKVFQISRQEEIKVAIKLFSFHFTYRIRSPCTLLV